ncbi:MAG: hypothetical protein M1812_004267 [Candelaria pacifica]|nr:MAG: hypothetical protein M1812_004267 [Candelaria pacifica]
MSTEANSPPPGSPMSSTSSGRTGTPLSLDLSSVPALINPSPPSNTLLITNLQDPSIFRPENLLQIRTLINQSAPLHSWSPLKSFRRIVISLYTIPDAIRIRQVLDGEAIMSDQVRVYFGEPTPIEPIDQHLHAPSAGKLFFISPPPSPPHGWEMRNEAPPNKDVHAEDLASALAKLHAKPVAKNNNNNNNNHSDQDRFPASPISPIEEGGNEREWKRQLANRQRSGSSTLIYRPEDHGDSPHLPAVMVEDTTGSADEISPIESARGETMIHTARPPVELMEDV